MADQKFNKKELYKKTEKELNLDGTSDKLAKAPFEKVKPILIQMARIRSANTKPAEILKDYESKGDFYGVSSINPKKILEFGMLFYSVLPSNIVPVEVSPIMPIGLNSVLTKLSQDISLATINNSEVVSDPTTPLVLECARIKKYRAMSRGEVAEDAPIELATMKRVLRLQPFDKSKGYMQHFNLLGICSAGRHKDSTPIIIKFMEEHVSVWLDFIEKLRANGYTFNNVSLKFSDAGFLDYIIKKFNLPRETIGRNAFNEDFDFIKEYSIPLPKEVDSIGDMIKANPDNLYSSYGKSYLFAIEKLLLEKLKNKYKNVKFSFDFARKAGLGYYNNACFHIFGSNSEGETIQIADDGTVDWLAKLTNNNKEQCVTSGFGAELIQKLFYDNIK